MVAEIRVLVDKIFAAFLSFAIRPSRPANRGSAFIFIFRRVAGPTPNEFHVREKRLPLKFESSHREHKFFVNDRQNVHFVFDSEERHYPKRSEESGGKLSRVEKLTTFFESSVNTEMEKETVSFYKSTFSEKYLQLRIAD